MKGRSKGGAGLEWIRPAQQERARQTADRIFAALEEMLVHKSFRETTVAEIAAKARSSVGAFYARFQDKDALLQAAHEAFAEESIATAEAGLDPARWQGVPLEELIGIFVSFVVEHYRERRGLRRAIAEMQWLDERYRARASRVAACVSRLLAALLEERREEHAHADPAVAAEVVHRIVFAVLDQHVQYAGRPPGAVALDDAQLEAELVRLVESYLGVHTPDAPGAENAREKKTGRARPRAGAARRLRR